MWARTFRREKYRAGRRIRTTKRKLWGRQVGKDIQERKVGQAGGPGHSEWKKWGRQVGQAILEGKVGP